MPIIHTRRHHIMHHLDEQAVLDDAGAFSNPTPRPPPGSIREGELAVCGLVSGGDPLGRPYGVAVIRKCFVG